MGPFILALLALAAAAPLASLACVAAAPVLPVAALPAACLALPAAVAALEAALPAAVFAANYENGLYVGQIALNAEPFLVYSAENPGDYGIGKYAGLACVWTPSRGFKQVFFNLTVTNLIVP